MTKLKKHIRLFNKEAKNTGKIFDEQSGLLYWDEHNPAFYEVYRELTGNFWIPQEVSLKTDSQDWNENMSEEDLELYKRGISQLVLLDSIATVIDGQFAAYIKNPAIKAIMSYVASQEAIHNESYTYIASTFMTKEETAEVFETPKTDKLILGASELILREFENFISDPTPTTLVRAMIAMANLEGVRFTNGFTPFYMFAREGKMQGTAQIIQFIQRDELQHSYFQTLVARQLVTEYPEINSEEINEWVYDFFKEVVEGEKALASDMYKNHSTINMNDLHGYIEWRANLLLQNLGLTKIFETKINPLQWIKAYDPSMQNSFRDDFHEKRPNDYSRTSEDENSFDEL